ncbi:DUF943 family protein [Klebsiella sp. Ap-873]|nr:DUF943 family protein [Klebsiella sp. Ap-873]
MRVKNKKSLSLLCISVSVLASYLFWQSTRPVEIVAVHKDGNHASVLVKSFPFTELGKINWWLKNKKMLKYKYDIPNPGPNGSFTVVFWDFGEGYKEEGKYDRRCFKDKRTKKNCVDKNSLMFVKDSNNTGVSFWLESGIYSIKNDEMVREDY